METVKLIQVGLVGGDASNARSAVCVDLDRGHAAEEWAALVRPKKVQALLDETGAIEVSRADWEGEPFGDGNGTVERLADGSIAGDGLYARALVA